MTSNEYDLIVIGAGGAGNTAAGNATVLGKRVALIKRDKLGGTCLNYGCDPTKTLCTPPRCFTMHVTPPPGFVGRLPALDALNLEAAGVQYTEEVITTDATLPQMCHTFGRPVTLPYQQISIYTCSVRSRRTGRTQRVCPEAKSI